MKLPLHIEGLQGPALHLSVGFIGNPKIICNGELLKGTRGIYKVKDHAGNDVTISIKKNWIDRLPHVEINNVPINIGSSLTWYDRLLIGFPLFLAVPAGLSGGMVGLLCSVLSLRVFRGLETSSIRYGLSALTSIVITGTFLLYWINSGSAYALDDPLKKDLQRYMDGVEVSWQDNNIPNAMRLDQQGRKLWSQGKEKEVYDIYQKVLAISYDHGSLQGIMNSLGMLSLVFETMDNHKEATKVAKLAYKVGRLIDDPYEYGLAELRLAHLLGKDSRRLQILWRMKAKKSLKGTPYKHDYVGLLNNFADDLRWLGLQEEAMNVYEEAYTLSQKLGNSTGHKWSKWEVALSYGRALKKEGANAHAIEVMQKVLPTFAAAEQESIYYSYLLKELADCYDNLNKDNLAKGDLPRRLCILSIPKKPDAWRSRKIEAGQQPCQSRRRVCQLPH